MCVLYISLYSASVPSAAFVSSLLLIYMPWVRDLFQGSVSDEMQLACVTWSTSGIYCGHFGPKYRREFNKHSTQGNENSLSGLLIYCFNQYCHQIQIRLKVKVYKKNYFILTIFYGCKFNLYIRSHTRHKKNPLK